METTHCWPCLTFQNSEMESYRDILFDDIFIMRTNENSTWNKLHVHQIWNVLIMFLIGGIHKPCAWTEFWEFLTNDPLPYSWTILLNKAYIVIWSFGWPPPLPCPHGLWITPFLATVPISHSHVTPMKLDADGSKINVDKVCT